MRTFKSIIDELVWRHKDIGHTQSKEHFCQLGDESQVHSDARLLYPCVLYSEEPDGFIDNGQELFRQSVVTLLFLDHVEDTGDFHKVEETTKHMQQIAEDFIRGIHLMTLGTQIDMERSGLSIERVENVDACLYGKALQLRITEPFCLTIAGQSPFIPGGIFDSSFDDSFYNPFHLSHEE